MRNAWFLPAALVLMLFVPMGGAARADSGNLTVQALSAACRQDAATPAGSFCLGYLQGAAQVLTMVGGEGPKAGTGNPEIANFFSREGLCPSARSGKPSGSAMIQAFLGWSAKHPQALRDDAFFGARKALAAAWPCPVH